jgi:hypothetical protein
MFKMIKVMLLLVGLVGLAYFSFFVPLGDHTLYEHLVGISETDEAQQLGDEIEKKAQDISEDVAESVPALVGKGDGEPSEAGIPLSQISDEDRTALSELLKKKNE